MDAVKFLISEFFNIIIALLSGVDFSGCILFSPFLLWFIYQVICFCGILIHVLFGRGKLKL